MNVTYQNGWAVPAGWKLVPEKPTYELASEIGGVRMDEESFLHEYADHEKIGEICRAVVKYSPPPPKAPDYNPGPLEVSVVGMPEFDALLDHIYEEGTGSEGAVHLANKLVRVVIQSHITRARNAQPAPDVEGLVGKMGMLIAAGNRLNAEAEECTYAGNMAEVAGSEYWCEFRDALEAATEDLAAQVEGGGRR